MCAATRGDQLTRVTKISDGHYAKKQLRCPSSIVSFSHHARFRKAIALAGVDPDGALLDYGSGDGTFLGLVADRFATCLGADIALDQVEDCRHRFAAVPNVRFCQTSDLAGPEHTAAYHVVTCMEVLEHCTPRAVDGVLSDLSRLVAPKGRILISVPIETGPSFLLKYAVRTTAGWRGLSDYRHYESYSPLHTARMLFASARTNVPRPVYGEAGAEFHSHYGFNWRRLRDRVRESLIVERTLFSPFDVPGGWFSSQAWLICRPPSI